MSCVLNNDINIIQINNNLGFETNVVMERTHQSIPKDGLISWKIEEVIT